MKNASAAKVRIILLVLLVLILAQAFNCGLGLMSLEKIYFKSITSSYQALALDLRRNILGPLRFGMSLEKFMGLKDLLTEVKSAAPDLQDAVVLDPGGRVLHSLSGKPERPGWSETDREARAGRFEGVHIRRDPKAVRLLLPLRGADGKDYGSVGLSFSRTAVQERLKAVVLDSLGLLSLTIGGAAVLLVLFLFFFTSWRADFQRQPVRHYAVFIVCIIGAQLVFSYYNVDRFRGRYMDAAREKLELSTRILKTDLEYLLEKGVEVASMVNIDLMLGEIIRVTPELEGISIHDRSRKVLYQAGPGEKEEPGDQGGRESIYDVWAPLALSGPNGSGAGEEPEVKGYIHLQLSRSVIEAKIREIILDSATVAAISLLFVIELMMFLFYSIRREADVCGPEEDYAVFRPLIFLYLLAMSLSQSFIPLRMKELYEPLWGLSRDMILGLPVSAEMGAAALMLLPAGAWLDRRGWRAPFFFGLALSLGGAVLSGTAGSAREFIAARLITGLGYGLTWLSAQGFILANTGVESKARGLSNLVAGIFAGQICGAAVGGMLAERLGFAQVFFTAAGFVVFIIVLSAFILGRFRLQADQVRPGSEGRSLRNLAGCLFDRRVFSGLWLSAAPLSICVVGVLFFACPLYLKDLGKTQSDIGRALMIFGLFPIYLAPLVGRFVDRSENKARFLVFSGLVGSLGLLPFEYFSGMAVMLFAIMMLGLAGSLGGSAQTVYVINSPAAAKMGPGAALSLQRMVDKFGQMLGPLLLGGLAAVYGLRSGLALLGLLYLGATFLFLITAWPDGRGRRKGRPRAEVPEPASS